MRQTRAWATATPRRAQGQNRKRTPSPMAPVPWRVAEISSPLQRWSRPRRQDTPLRLQRQNHNVVPRRVPDHATTDDEYLATVCSTTRQRSSDEAHRDRSEEHTSELQSLMRI